MEKISNIQLPFVLLYFCNFLTGIVVMVLLTSYIRGQGILFLVTVLA